MAKDPDYESTKHLFDDEPHDPSLNYIVMIEGFNDHGKWVIIGGPCTANDALDQTDELHKQWACIRFTKMQN